MVDYAYDAVGFARELLRWSPDQAQCEVLDSPKRRVILNWGRQSGKTTLAAVKMIHCAYCWPGSLCVWLSANKEHTAEVFGKIDGYLQKLGIAPKGEPGKSIGRRLPNGSRMVGLAARDATVRSYTATLVVIDEGAQVKDEVYDAVMPVLAVRNGTLWVLGTPRGKSGRFWEIWAKGAAGEWFKSLRKTADCGRVPQSFLDSERKLKGDVVMRREYECEFVEDGLKLLLTEHVDALFE